MNPIDVVIDWFSPARGLRRRRARMASTQLRRYEGAALGRRMGGWNPIQTSANGEIGIALRLLRERHRDLARNNPWVCRALDSIRTNTIGYGIKAKITGTSKVQQLWAAWAESTQCDADGQHDIYGLQSLMMRAIAESGEVLVRRRWRKPGDGFAIPMQLQVLESDYLDTGKTQALQNGGYIIQGVQFTAFGQREGYWLFQVHPGDSIPLASVFSQTASVFVPASEIAHIFRMDRPGQVRGVPWGAPVMVTLRDLDDYEDAYLFRQKIANCQVGVVVDGRDSPDVAPLAPNTQQSLPALSEHFEPGRFDYAPEGKDIKFNTPPTAGDYGPYTQSVLLRVAAAYGITFASLTGDLSQVNFSSGRMGWLDMNRNIDSWRWNMFIPQGLGPIEQWFKDAIDVGFGIPTVNIKFDWTPPAREMIDPTKELDAYAVAVRNGFSSLPEVHRALGMDTPSVLKEIADTNAELDKLKITIDSDPRKDSATQADAGLPQEKAKQ